MYHSLEKQPSSACRPRITLAAAGIVVCQHILLYSSLHVLASTIYVLVRSGFHGQSAQIRDATILVPAITALVAATVSITYLVLHHLETHHLSTSQITMSDISFQRGAKIVLEVGMMGWLTAAGLGIIFILARQPSCLPSGSKNVLQADTGATCVVQRTGLGAEMLALIASVCLFALLVKTPEPFRCHLFGRVSRDTSLPISSLTEKPSRHKSRPQLQTSFSEMSFKCRSSSNASTNTLLLPRPLTTPPPATTRLPSDHRGLGISTPSAPLLAARPSLTSIRSLAVSKPPHSHHQSLPSQPLPPLPAYFPRPIYAPPPQTNNHMCAPTRPPPPVRPIRLTPPIPTLQLTRSSSVVSASSVYSRSTNGCQTPQPTPLGPRVLHTSASNNSLGASSCSSGSSRSTVRGSNGVRRCSPLGVVTVAEEPEAGIGSLRENGGRGTGDVLVGSLPAVKRVGGFEDVERWG